jgi:thymidylate synthase (FAD)
VLETAHRYYQKYQGRLPREDMRFVLPQAQTTNLLMTMNFRELVHAASLRLCTRAQWEIRELFGRIKEELGRVESFLAEFLVPKCEELGYCPEEDSCGHIKTVRGKGLGTSDRSDGDQ